MLGEDGAHMNAYSVYRVDYQANKTERIGRLVDRRKGERRNNAEDMLRLAQSQYSYSALCSHIFIIRERSPGLF
jgi:hypothetical protein